MTGMPPIVRVSHHFPFPPEMIFDAWLDPKTIGLWLFATPDGVMKSVSLDARAGGGFTIDEQRGGMLARHIGSFVEIDRPRRLVFDVSAGVAGAELGAPVRVTASLAPDGAGTRLALDLENVWAGYEERTKAGWTMILNGLAETLEGRRL